MAKVKSLWEDQQEARFEQLRTEVIEDYRGRYHADDDGDVIDEIAWERQQAENGEDEPNFSVKPWTTWGELARQNLIGKSQ